MPTVCAGCILFDTKSWLEDVKYFMQSNHLNPSVFFPTDTLSDRFSQFMLVMYQYDTGSLCIFKAFILP